MTLTVGGLCEGYAGIFLGLAEVLDVEHAWYSEYEPPTPKHPKPAQAAAKVLAHRFLGVPNHGDLTAVDWSQVEPVDLLTAGWPCQPWSQAGQRKGAEDDRAIWPYVAAAIRNIRPRYVLLENVSAITGAGELARACGDLAKIGYDTCWTCVRASDVHAPHRRERIFIVAADTAGLGRDQRFEGLEESITARHRRSNSRGVPHLATDPDVPGLEGHRELHATPREGEAGAHDRGDVATDPDWAGYGPAIHRWERVLGRPAPNPTVLGQRGGRQLNPVFVEFLMGLPEGWVTDVPELTRNQKLKVLGNGCVPQQVAAAVRHLFPLLLDQTTEMAA